MWLKVFKITRNFFVVFWKTGLLAKSSNLIRSEQLER